MPYVPSMKTDGKSQDRILIDAAVELVAHGVANSISTNLEVLQLYHTLFHRIAQTLQDLVSGFAFTSDNHDTDLAKIIFDVGAKYGYQGAFLGELNYAITRLIQRVPQIMVETGKWPVKDEIRYWLYAVTVEALISTADSFKSRGLGIGGVFEDVKDEYKRRMNTAYEAEQIKKSGDCFDGPFYTRLIEVVDENGLILGYQEVMLKRSESTINTDILDYEIRVKSKNENLSKV